VLAYCCYRKINMCKTTIRMMVSLTPSFLERRPSLDNRRPIGLARFWSLDEIESLSQDNHCGKLSRMSACHQALPSSDIASWRRGFSFFLGSKPSIHPSENSKAVCLSSVITLWRHRIVGKRGILFESLHRTHHPSLPWTTYDPSDVARRDYILDKNGNQNSRVKNMFSSVS
jgi:hypothetical protein